MLSRYGESPLQKEITVDLPGRKLPAQRDAAEDHIRAATFMKRTRPARHVNQGSVCIHQMREQFALLRSATGFPVHRQAGMTDHNRPPQRLKRLPPEGTPHAK